jgi:hypothetical protein
LFGAMGFAGCNTTNGAGVSCGTATGAAVVVCDEGDCAGAVVCDCEGAGFAAGSGD